MPPIIGTAFLPHPPIMIPAIGKGEEMLAHKTLTGIKQIASIISDSEFDTIVVLTPHGTTNQQTVTVNVGQLLSGNLDTFGHAEVELHYQNNLEIVKLLESALRNEGLYFEKTIMPLDHGAVVPLFFIGQPPVVNTHHIRLIHMAVNSIDYNELYCMGKIMGAVLQPHALKVLILASGDLSHRLKEAGPYGYHPAGPVFDQKVAESVKSNRLNDLLSIPGDLIKRAGQCGLGPFIMATGMMNHLELETTLYSYEAPFGVGYLCGMAVVKPQLVHPAVWLATEAIKHWLTKKAKLDMNRAWKAEKTLQQSTFWIEARQRQAGVFVSLHQNGILRGCIGTIQATTNCIGEEIIMNAIQSATSDPRFSPLSLEELEGLEVKVDVLGDLELVTDDMELNVQKYGIMVEAGYKRGVLLPALEGINSVEQQLSIVLEKAGILKGESYVLKRFIVSRYQKHHGVTK
ncbi:AmmeMemoRadiSam system protein A [Anoxynatronum sibiricum]|uniref:AmmeMemoRadiSam system protein A n=1 Tax=Anoxynatronum sibiricum TaxID=210623 RepID=A0ABU9VV29_9CLOT